MRDANESIVDFEARLAAEVAGRPDEFFRRGIVVRLDDELPVMRRDLLDRVLLIRYGHDAAAHPRNTDACNAYGSVCPFFGACAGREDIDDTTKFPRRGAHPELAIAK
jgi:hypothetical protein